MRTKRRLTCLFVAALVLLAACDGNGGSEPGADDTRGSPTSPRDRNNRRARAQERVIEQGDTISAGPHVAASFRPQFSFRFSGENPWRASLQSPQLFILRADGPNQIFFARPDEVYLYEGETPTLGAAPADLRGWVESNPHFKITGRPQVSVGATRATAIDVEVTSVAEGQAGDCPIDCVPLVPLGIAEKAFFLSEGQAARFVFLSPGGEQMFVGITSSPSDFKRFTHNSERLLKTVRF